MATSTTKDALKLHKAKCLCGSIQRFTDDDVRVLGYGPDGNTYAITCTNCMKQVVIAYGNSKSYYEAVNASKGCSCDSVDSSNQVL